MLANGQKPNFFISLKISEGEVTANVRQLQQRLIECPAYREFASPENLSRAMVFPNLLHFTLAVLNLNEPEDLPKANQVFKDCCIKIQNELEETPLNITVGGLGYFGDTVLFAKIKGEQEIDRLTKFSEMFKSEFTAAGFPGDPRPFSPHMTICNLYYLRPEKEFEGKQKNIRSMSEELWLEAEKRDFGTERVKTIQLSRMKGMGKRVAEYKFE